MKGWKKGWALGREGRIGGTKWGGGGGTKNVMASCEVTQSSMKLLLPYLQPPVQLTSTEGSRTPNPKGKLMAPSPSFSIIIFQSDSRAVSKKAHKGNPGNQRGNQRSAAR